MKKYLSWVICAILLFAAWFLPQNDAAVIAGGGNGKSEKVDSVKDVGNVLRTLCNTNTTKDYIELASFQNNAEENIEEEYTSVTLEFDTVVNFSAKYNWKTVTRDMQRSMTCYFTPKEAYYIVSYNSCSSDEENGGSGISMAFELYINMEENIGLMKVSRYSMAIKNQDAEPNKFPEGALNKWVDMQDAFFEVNEKNYLQMAIIGEYILSAESDKFLKSGDTYSLKKNSAKELCCTLADIIGAATDMSFFKDAEFSVNLSSKTSPVIAMLYTIKQSTERYENDQYEMKAGERMTCRISNINNTVINFPSNIQTYNISDFE